MKKRILFFCLSLLLSISVTFAGNLRTREAATADVIHLVKKRLSITRIKQMEGYPNSFMFSMSIDNNGNASIEQFAGCSPQLQTYLTEQIAQIKSLEPELLHGSPIYIHITIEP